MNRRSSMIIVLSSLSSGHLAYCITYCLSKFYAHYFLEHILSIKTFFLALMILFVYLSFTYLSHPFALPLHTFVHKRQCHHHYARCHHQQNVLPFPSIEMHMFCLYVIHRSLVPPPLPPTTVPFDWLSLHINTVRSLTM